MLRYAFLLAACTAGHVAAGQTRFSGIVGRSHDSSRLSQARVTVGATTVVTDATGRFSVPLPTGVTHPHVRIMALGIDTSFEVSVPAPAPVWLLVRPQSFLMADVTVHGLTARQVVDRAVERIPRNYPDSGYVYTGFYRAYQTVDSAFHNLLEARVAAIILPKAGAAEQSFAPLAIRRQRFRGVGIEGFDGQDGIVSLFESNPVFFLRESSLARPLRRISSYRFDTAARCDTAFVVDYRCERSSEGHGIQSERGDYDGESYEVGRLVIDRRSFAFIRIERHAYRNKAYNYPYFNNFVMPHKRHTGEFVEGHLDLQYRRLGDRWHPDRLCYGYVNEFFRTAISGQGREFAVGEFFEWHTDSASRSVSKDLLPRFSKEPGLYFTTDGSDAPLTQPVPPFFFHDGARVYQAAGWTAD